MTGSVELLTTSSSVLQVPHSFSPDGSQLVLTQVSSKTGRDLFLLTVDGLAPHVAGAGQAQPLLEQPLVNEINGEISLNGHWLAYQSNESNQDEIYVRPFPSVGNGRWPISTGGASSRCGRETGVSCSIATVTASYPCRSRQRRP